MGAIYQYWLYSRCAKRGASDAWVRGGKDRAQTVVALGLLIDTLRQQGYTFVFPTIDRSGP